jgi:hypothetical protein
VAKAILIDAYTREVKQVEVGGLSDMQKAVQGYIESAGCSPNGDTLFVNEEGLLQDPTHFFMLEKLRPMPLAGNGLLVGGETQDGELTDVHATVEDVQTQVKFFTIEQIRALINSGVIY